MLLKDAIIETGYAYLHSTWIPHKHFGHVATSRVEGGHAILKKWIAVSTGIWQQFMTNWFSRLNSSAKEQIKKLHTIVHTLSSALVGAFGQL